MCVKSVKVIYAIRSCKYINYFTQKLLLRDYGAGVCVYRGLPIVFRYAGYCPQLKYNVGKSYGQLTAELLSSPEVKHSNRLVLHTGHIPSTESDAGLTLRSIPDSNLKKMIPGYTGRHHTLCNAGGSTA